MKGNALAAMVIAMIGIVIAIAVVSNVVMQTTFQPLAPVVTTVTNSTALNNINATPFTNQQFTTSNIDNSVASSIKITYQLGTGKEINVTVMGTDIGNLSGTSPQTIAIPKTITLANPVIVNYTYLGVSTAGVNATNITSSVLYYNQKGSYYGWNSGTQAVWLIVGIAVVAALLMFVFGNRP